MLSIVEHCDGKASVDKIAMTVETGHHGVVVPLACQSNGVFVATSRQQGHRPSSLEGLCNDGSRRDAGDGLKWGRKPFQSGGGLVALEGDMHIV